MPCPTYARSPRITSAPLLVLVFDNNDRSIKAPRRTPRNFVFRKTLELLVRGKYLQTAGIAARGADPARIFRSFVTG
jgi:hypothetical protein